MKTFTFLLFVFCSLIACSPKTSLPTIDPQTTQEETPSLQENTPPEVLPEKDAFQGEFHSMRGVMNPLSCYCYNGGYLMEDGQRIPLCFDKGEMEVECRKVKVQGFYKTIKVDANPQSPCPAGSRKVFMVQTYECY